MTRLDIRPYGGLYRYAQRHTAEVPLWLGLTPVDAPDELVLRRISDNTPPERALSWDLLVGQMVVTRTTIRKTGSPVVSVLPLHETPHGKGTLPTSKYGLARLLSLDETLSMAPPRLGGGVMVNGEPVNRRTYSAVYWYGWTVAKLEGLPYTNPLPDLELLGARRRIALSLEHRAQGLTEGQEGATALLAGYDNYKENHA